jgi:hypothetical protein
MRAESRNGWCKQPPILGYVRTFEPRSVLELKERGVRNQHQSQRKYQASKAFTPKTKPRGVSTRQLNKCHSTNTTEDWRRIPYDPSDLSNQYLQRSDISTNCGAGWAAGQLLRLRNHMSWKLLLV